MKKTVAQTTMIFLISICIAACSITYRDAQNIVLKAHNSYKVAIGKASGDQSYQKELEKSGELLEEAQSALEQKYKTMAWMNAAKSIGYSQEVIREIYKKSLIPETKTAIQKIKEIVKKEPDSPLKDLIPKLEDVLTYSERVIQGEELDDLEKEAEKHIEIVETSNDNIQYSDDLKETTASDVSFDTGKYRLTNRRKRLFEQTYSRFINKVINIKNEFTKKYPDRKILLKIKVIGYTDEAGFQEGTRLIGHLEDGIKKSEIPRRNPERRKFLNKRLSVFRARTIGEYLKELILKSESGGSNLKIKQEIIGRGEEIPPGVDAPYNITDSRRRICKIFSMLSVQTEPDKR